MPGIIWNGEIPHSSLGEGFLFLLFVVFFPSLHPNMAPLANSFTPNPTNNLGSAGKYSFSCSYTNQQC